MRRIQEFIKLSRSVHSSSGSISATNRASPDTTVDILLCLNKQISKGSKMAIRILPDGTMEADTPAEFKAAANAWHKLTTGVVDTALPTRRRSFESAFPEMWESWGTNIQLALTWLYHRTSPMSDSNLKKQLGYSDRSNHQLAGTMQGIGKVTKRLGFDYSDVIEKGSVTRGNGTGITYFLTQRARDAMSKVRRPKL